MELFTANDYVGRSVKHFANSTEHMLN